MLDKTKEEIMARIIVCNKQGIPLRRIVWNKDYQQGIMI
jgi:hypothetical protein